MSLFSYPNQLKEVLGDRAFDLKDEQVSIDKQITFAANSVKTVIDKFSDEFFKFRSYGLQTRNELKESITEETKEQIEEILRCDEDENPFEELFWDQMKVHEWI